MYQSSRRRRKDASGANDKEIYEGAALVVAWLGPEAPHTKEAITTAMKLVESPDVHWRLDHRGDQSALAINIEQYRALPAWFSGCAWWTRIWTVQEYYLAKDFLFICGSFCISKCEIERLSTHYRNHAHCCPGLLSLIGEGDRAEAAAEAIEDVLATINEMKFLELHGYTSEGIPILIGLFRTRYSTKPEDKVYGLAGLIENFDENIINNGTSARYVYENFTNFMIKSSQTLDALTQVIHPCSTRVDDSGPKTTVPSWVPNWEAPVPGPLSRTLLHRNYYLRFHSTSKGMKYESMTERNGVLSVQGVFWDTIASVGIALGETLTAANLAIFRPWYTFVSVHMLSNHYVTGCTARSAFWRTLCMNVRRSDGRPEIDRASEAYFEAYKSWWAFVKEQETSDSRPVDAILFMPDTWDFDFSIGTSAICRRFFISDKGYMGLAPAYAEPSDQLAVLFGGKVPYILRKNEPDSSGTTWTFIGDSYVHGIMDGEVIEMLEIGEVESKVIRLR